MKKEMFTFSELESLISREKVIVFGGFMSYCNPEKLKSSLTQLLKKELKEHPDLVVVCGSSAEGIGLIYEITKKLSPLTTTIGLTSEKYRAYGVSEHCDYVFYANTPDSHLLDEHKESYMVSIAKHNGKLIYLGGGDVSKAEIKEAYQRKICFDVYPNYLPSEEVMIQKIEKQDFNFTPLKEYLLNELNLDIDSEGCVKYNAYKPYKASKIV
jgi:hypothetical protein